MDLYELIQFVDSIGVEKVSPEEFENASNNLKNNINLTQDEQLQFYGLYKQSTVGPININRPMLYDIIGTSKWDSWKTFECLPKVKAQIAYVYLVNNLKESNDSHSMTVTSVSTLNHINSENETWGELELIFNLVVQNNESELDNYLKNHSDMVNIKNDEGLSPLHFAADRGYINIVSILLAYNADINSLDNSNQTPLMYAAYCDNEDVFMCLIKAGANINIENNDGETIEKINQLLFVEARDYLNNKRYLVEDKTNDL